MQVSIDQLKVVLAEIPQVKFAYLFGSHARGDAGPLSDIDVAVYLDRRLDPFRFRLSLLESLAHRLGTERFDLVTLNDASPLLRYEVVRQGVVIKENRQRRIPFEVRALSEYFDTEHLRKTQREYLKEQFGSGVRGGQ
ncbi:type VII toxin-antitoxin system MntA family adenylyltransferase antitoxin [Geoalkalibacter halelectricus]|uniref:Nucleotidyltransferase domain-containing protein n=1 Tax=Geoalkalibacter halelectricus TaxID=2847045 RepID=A0ABY5ZTJ3_9BACT|nr:nucleotidyltransferase domain-containing protein [Geoalkalibacter halelectricus]MDO3376772.1 nucleotidyltransferase domain-containing protein [Geoalkalibacter halelectricus]UWZ81277.1 nucleotidyltransferase domain-containing protein [Geoalkalibacter halelectricus]